MGVRQSHRQKKTYKGIQEYTTQITLYWVNIQLLVHMKLFTNKFSVPLM